MSDHHVCGTGAAHAVPLLNVTACSQLLYLKPRGRWLGSQCVPRIFHSRLGLDICLNSCTLAEMYGPPRVEGVN